ncbi:tRNA pseudouridine(55) synthase TruB, partial [Candidatus Peregrinibacteria bacterium]|nr:tRNA pseudouridine(55) synthase TruB [Candidatus Peregrinibacteria bacterium]
MRHGFLLVHKPKGPTSHDVVQIVRSLLHENNIGHLGTLDPAASGLLILAVGSKSLKVIELFQNLPKEYSACVHFGAVSSTYDGEGNIETVSPLPGWSPPDLSTIQRLIETRFQGVIEQTPPAYSAIKIEGVRAYRRARRGVAITPAPRQVEIQTCVIEEYAYPLLTLRIACGAGTYIRSLAHDLGHELRCGGYLQDLRRTKVGLPAGALGAKAGEWSIDAAIVPESAQWTQVIPLKEVLKPFPSIDLTETEA